MRIISKFNDYYDSALGYGEDRSLVYERKTEDFEISSNQEKNLPYVNKNRSYRLSRDKWDTELFYLGFCGKIYPVVKFSERYPALSPSNFNPIVRYLYSLEQVQEFCKENNIELRDEKEYFSKYSRGYDVDSVRSLTRFFNQTDFMGLEKIFAEKNIPLFTYKSDPTSNSNKTMIQHNPSLKDVQFFKVKDSFSCFQEISMFVGGVLKSKENEMVQISDEDKIAKHGYDKWSFRKMGKNSKK